MHKPWQVMRAVMLVMLAGVPSMAVAQQPPAPPPLRQIPGLTAPDQFPRGCVDCHVNRPDLKLDVRLSTLIGQWQNKVDSALFARVRRFTPAAIPLKGKHPKINAATAEIPKTCLMCHSRASKLAPPFVRLLHGLHLVGGADNHFMTMYQGECTYCHKLDKATGAWSLGGGIEKQ